MDFALGPHAAAAGVRLRAFDSVGSTNGEALLAAADGETGPIWLVSDHQTGGRGRRGRAWLSPKGNLAATLLLTVRSPAAPLASLGFVAGLALDRALGVVAPAIAVDIALDAARGTLASPARLQLKWPNDVLLSGAKLAGILLEAQPRPDGGTAVAVGIGVNVAAAPDGLPYPVACLADLGASVSAPAVFAALSDAWLEVAAIWDDGRGFAAIRDLWLARAAGIGAPVAVRIGPDVMGGTFETLDEMGRLVIRRVDGTRAEIAAGEVHFGAVASLKAG